MKPFGTTRQLELRFGNRSALKEAYPWHAHAETELVSVTKGRCRITAGDKVLEGARGAIFVLPACVPQYTEPLGMARTTYLGFNLPPGLFDESARVLTFDPADPALHWMEQLCDGRWAHPPLSNHAGRTLLMALLQRLG